MNSRIDQELLGFVQSNSVTATTVTIQTDLIEQEVLDSLLLMELVLFVEQQWGVQLIGNDFSPSHFRTVEQLTQLVETRRLQQSA
ncbi:MAG: acyl carrier protein [Mariniblastus sp.]|nr:acyl carrier protein [Mariniblastus sp.]